MRHVKSDVKNRDAQNQYFLSQADMTQLWLGAFVAGYQGALKRWFTCRRPKEPMLGIEKKAAAFGCSAAVHAISIYKTQGRLPVVDCHIEDGKSHAVAAMVAEDLMAFYEPACAEGFLAGWTVVVFGLLKEYEAYRDAVPCAKEHFSKALEKCAQQEAAA